MDIAMPLTEVSWTDRDIIVLGQGPDATVLQEVPRETVIQEASNRGEGDVDIGTRDRISCHLAARTVTCAPKVKLKREGGSQPPQ